MLKTVDNTVLQQRANKPPTNGCVMRILAHVHESVLHQLRVGQVPVLSHRSQVPPADIHDVSDAKVRGLQAAQLLLLALDPRREVLVHPEPRPDVPAVLAKEWSYHNFMISEWIGF